MAFLLGSSWLDKAEVNARSNNPTDKCGFPAANYQDHSAISGFQVSAELGR